MMVGRASYREATDLTWNHNEMIEAALSDDKLIYQVEASPRVPCCFLLKR